MSDKPINEPKDSGSTENLDQLQQKADAINTQAEQLNTEAKTHADVVKSQSDKIQEYRVQAEKIARATKDAAIELSTRMAPKISSFLTGVTQKFNEANQAIQELRKKQQAKSDAAKTAAPADTAVKTETSNHKSEETPDRHKPE